MNSNVGDTTNSMVAVTLSQRQPPLMWNGSQWINSAASGSPSSPTSSENVSALSASESAPAKVAMYTSYYHKWNASYLKFIEMKRQDAKNKDLDNQIQWAKYYADLSSQAAHFFFNNPTAITVPFQLPPAPLDNNSNHLMNTNQTSSEKQSLKQTQPKTNADTCVGEASLKRYVDRCLLQCKSPQDKNQMIRLIENMIQQLLQMNQFDTMNWETKQLLQLSCTSPIQTISERGFEFPVDVNGKTQCSTVTSQPQNLQSFSINNNQNNINSSNALTNTIHSSWTKRNLDSTSASCGYYGPSTATTTGDSVVPLSGRETKKRNRKNNYMCYDAQRLEKVDNGYYGPNITNNLSTSCESEDFISLPIGQNLTQQRHPGKGYGGFNNTDTALNDRSKRFGEILRKDKIDNINSDYDRFMGRGTIGSIGIGRNLIVLDDLDYAKMTIKGTCEILEKDYLRLTAPPRAELVRPLHTLQQHFKQLKDMRSSASTRNRIVYRDYLWFCSQLKAIRQDCTVQRIQNSFAVDVYETHARYALEEDDLNEYNQCQTQLEELYKIHDNSLSQDNKHIADKEKALSNRNEFIAYRIIYHVFLTGNKKYNGGSSDLLKIMSTLKVEQLLDDTVRHALNVREACCNVDLFNYHLFFRLYASCRNHGKYLMKHMVPFVRHNALLRICKGYRPGIVDTEFVTKELGFGQHQEGNDWLRSCNCILSDDDSQLITKECIDIQESVTEEKKSLI
jgi:SAC3/GANP family